MPDKEDMELPRLEFKGLSSEAVRLLVRDAVQETLLGLGFDMRHPGALQADMYYLRRLRKAGEDARSIVRRSVLTLMLSAILYLLWNALVEYVRG